MSDSSFRVNRGITLNPQPSAPSNPTNGDVYYDSTLNTFVMYDNGFWINVASRSDVASAASLTSANFTAVVIQNPFVRITGSTAANLHGLTASTDGKQVIIYNQSSAATTIKNQSGSEGTAANRIITMTGLDVTLSAGMMAMFVYDASQSRWISDTFAAGSTASKAYPNVFLSPAGNGDTTTLSGAIALLPAAGGVILLMDNLTQSASQTIPNNVKLLGRDKNATITFTSSGTLNWTGNYGFIQDIIFSTALTSVSMVNVSGDFFTSKGCMFSVANNVNSVALEIQGASTLLENNEFTGVSYPSLGTGVKVDSTATDLVDFANVYTM